jgi:hypothetical protein
MTVASVRVSVSLVAGIFLITAAKGQISTGGVPASPRPPMTHTRPLSAPAPTKRVQTSGGLTQEDRKQLGEMLQHLTPKDRKNFTKAMKQLTPQQRRELVEGLKRQSAGKGTSSPAIRQRVVKAPPPLPHRLVF